MSSNGTYGSLALVDNWLYGFMNTQWSRVSINDSSRIEKLATNMGYPPASSIVATPNGKGLICLESGKIIYLPLK